MFCKLINRKVSIVQTFKHFNLGPGHLFSVILLPRKRLQSAVQLSPFSLAPNEEGRLWQEIT